MNEQAWQQWLATRPPQVQEMARKYPPATKFSIHGETVYLIGYGEFADGDVCIIITPIDPNENYSFAVASKQPICKCCMSKLDELKIT